MVISFYLRPLLERFTEIERENRKLLNKMREILGKTQTSFGGYTQSNLLKKLILTIGKPEEVNKQQKSLNRDGRKKELMKITMENQQFLKRL